MKTLRKNDIESMARELAVLKNPEKIVGGYELPEVVVTGIMPSGIQLNGFTYTDVSQYLSALKRSLGDSVASNWIPFSGMVSDCLTNMQLDMVQQIWGYTGSLYFSLRNTTPNSASPTYEMRLFGEDGYQIAFSDGCGGWW